MMFKMKRIGKRSAGIKFLLMSVFLILIVGISAGCSSQDSGKAASGGNAVNGDLVIPVNEISEEAKFYGVTIDGTDMEVIAVKASDGIIRTAFNTCEVCYASGRGYYKQSGDQLVCQNCGNSFTMDQVGVLGRGGCNPYSISDSDKTVTGQSITISKEFLMKSKSIFANWK